MFQTPLAMVDNLSNDDLFREAQFPTCFAIKVKT